MSELFRELTRSYDGLQVTELGRMLGLRLDARDRAKLEQVFATDSKGRPLEPEIWVTGDARRVRRVLITAVLGWLLLTQERRILWSSPSLAESGDEFDEVRALLADPANHATGVMHQVRGIRAVHGAQEIESHSGTRLYFRGRTSPHAHRGMAVTRLVIEGDADVRMLGALYPCLAGQPGPQSVRTIVNENLPD